MAKEIKEDQRQMIESRSKNLGKKCQKLWNNSPHHSFSLTRTNTPDTMHIPSSLSLSAKEVIESPPPTSNDEEDTKECKTDRRNRWEPECSCQWNQASYSPKVQRGKDRRNRAQQCCTTVRTFKKWATKKHKFNRSMNWFPGSTRNSGSKV